jgi:hypothetical protein
MRHSSLSGGGARLLLAAVASLNFNLALAYPRGLFHNAGYNYLDARDCPNPCGADSQYCCEANQWCTTLQNNVATCTGGGGGGGYAYLTTTWTETRTFTSTKMTFWEPAPEPTGTEKCIPTATEHQACGTICCAGWQTCATEGQCSAKEGVGGGATVIITASNGQVTTQYSAPYRITGTTTVVTSGVRTESSSGPTSTGDSDTIGAGDGEEDGGGGLSAGAIAGIVIGSLVGVALLLLLCFCCIARGLWNAIFGRKKTTKERVDVYEEGYSRHGSAAPHARRDRHTGWFGGGGRPASAGDRSEKKSGGKRWLGLAGLAATMLALLNLRKDKKPERRAGSRYTNSYYSYSDSGTRSSTSGGRRSAHTGVSRPSRGTRYSRSPRR